MIMMSASYYTNTLCLNFKVLAHWNNSCRVDISLHSDTISWFRVYLSLLLLLNDASWEEINTNICLWFELSRAQIQHTNHSTTNAVRCEGDYPIGCHIQVTFPPFNHWTDLETIINLDPFAVMERPLHIQKICIMQKFITALNRQTWAHGRIFVNATGQIRNEGHRTKTVFIRTCCKISLMCKDINLPQTWHTQAISHPTDVLCIWSVPQTKGCPILDGLYPTTEKLCSIYILWGP